MARRPSDKEIGSFGLALYEQLGPLTYADEKYGWPLLVYCGAVGQILQQSDTLAHSVGGAPWSALLDIERIPDEGLPWFGQFIGVDIDPTFTPNQQRQQIRDHESWDRGTPAALIKAVQKKGHLLDTQTVELVERDTSEYHFLIVTYETETPPDITYANLYEDENTYQDWYDDFASYSDYWFTSGHNFIDLNISQNKPGGLQYTYTVAPGAPGTLVSYLGIYLGFDTYQELWNDLQSYEEVYNFHE